MSIELFISDIRYINLCVEVHDLGGEARGIKRRGVFGGGALLVNREVALERNFLDRAVGLGHVLVVCEGPATREAQEEFMRKLARCGGRLPRHRVEGIGNSGLSTGTRARSSFRHLISLNLYRILGR